MNNKHSLLSRGSEWRKWDLHIHTPDTKLNNQYKIADNSIESLLGTSEWEHFCDKINNSDISVFGITDYFSIENYLLFIQTFDKKFPTSRKVFFPNIEFRIDSKNKDEEHIQFHVIFSNEKKVVSKIDAFLSRLRMVSTDDANSTNKYCCKEDLESVGFKKAMVKIDDLENGLKGDFADSEYLIIGLARGYGSLRPGHNDSRGAEYAKELDKKCHLFFGSSDDKDFFLDTKGYRSKYNLLPKPVLSGSDAHSFDKIGNDFVWIKVDPTFEGLRQILYEPSERISYGDKNPEFLFEKPYFNKIILRNEIPVYLETDDFDLKMSKTEIDLNKNLVTIIGGRGEGKSTLINYLGNALNKRNLLEDNKLTRNDNFNILYHKINSPNLAEEDCVLFSASKKEENQLPFVFISQGELKDKTKEKNRLSNTLKKILNIREANFDQDLATEIFDINKEIGDIEIWKQERDEANNLVNDLEYQNGIRKRNTKLLESLRNSKNKEDLESYNNNLQKISSFRKIIRDARLIKDITNNFLDEIKQIISSYDEIDKNILPLPKIEAYQNKILGLRELYEKHVTEVCKENDNIKRTLLSNGVSGDLPSLLENTAKFQNYIDRANIAIRTIKQKDDELIKLKEHRNSLGNKLKQEYLRQKEEIDEGWNNFLSKHPGTKRDLIKKILFKDNLEIHGNIKFDVDEFYENLSKALHRNTFKDIGSLKQQFKIHDIDSWCSYIGNNFNTFYDNLSHKKKEFINLFFAPDARSIYLKTEAKIKYNGRDLSRLSAGQKGTAYLRIQLANSAFSEPIIFDQPEDDLDNKFIVDELIDIFRELKKYRQIIIVTHNANLVVNSDAEQIIVAQNNNEILSYQSGSLENPIIQEFVCKILEGGEDAFRKRKQKYNII